GAATPQTAPRRRNPLRWLAFCSRHLKSKDIPHQVSLLSPRLAKGQTRRPHPFFSTLLVLRAPQRRRFSARAATRQGEGAAAAAAERSGGASDSETAASTTSSGEGGRASSSPSPRRRSSHCVSTAPLTKSGSSTSFR